MYSLKSRFQRRKMAKKVFVLLNQFRKSVTEKGFPAS